MRDHHRDDQARPYVPRDGKAPPQPQHQPPPHPQQQNKGPCPHCKRFHPGECRRKTGACIQCGKVGHYIKDCPDLKKGGQDRCKEGGPATLVPGRVYNMQAEEEHRNEEVIQACFGQPMSNGAALFQKACIGCHDMGGNIIQPGATLFLKDLQRNGIATEEEIYNITYYGKGRMPGFGEKCTPRGQCTFGPRLQEDEIKQLAEFVKAQADGGWPNISYGD